MICSTPASALQCSDILQERAFRIENVRQMKDLFRDMKTQEKAESFVDKLHESLGDAHLDLSYLKRKFIRDVTPFLGDFGLERLNKTLNILVKIGAIHLNNDFFTALKLSALKNIETHKSFHLVKFLEMMAKLRVAPGVDFLIKWEHQMIIKKRSFTTSTLTSVISSYGSLGFSPGLLFLKEWKEVFEGKISKFTPRQIANALYGVYLLNNKPLIEHFIKEVTWEQFGELLKDPVHARQASIVGLYMDRIWDVRPLKMSMFIGKFKSNVGRPDRKSELENKMAGALRNLLTVFEREYSSEPGFFVDFYIPAENKIIQTDGPLHYVVTYINGEKIRTLKVKDVLIGQILKSYGYIVERLDHNQVNNFVGYALYMKSQKSASVDHADQEGFTGVFGGFRPD